jgi:hypothetical protein
MACAKFDARLRNRIFSRGGNRRAGGITVKAPQSIQLTTSLPFRSEVHDNLLVLTCDVIKVKGIGRTVARATQNLKDSIALLLEGAIEDGVFERVLRDCGFQRKEHAGIAVWKAPFVPLANVPYEWLRESLTLFPRGEAAGGEESGNEPVVPFMISAGRDPAGQSVG